jgi:hypothetical protein
MGRTAESFGLPASLALSLILTFRRRFCWVSTGCDEIATSERGATGARIVGQETIQQITAEYPGWRFWWSRDIDGAAVELMATRTRDLTNNELKAGLSCTLPVGYGADIRDQLVQQARLEKTRVGTP